MIALTKNSLRFYDPWITDLRSNDLNKMVSRVGLPSLPNYRMSKYKCFTIQLVLIISLLLGILTTFYSHYCVIAYERSHYFNQDTFSHEINLNERPKRKGLIIVTNHRFGSTFLGQFFNQRSDAFYIFEPLIPFNENCSNLSDSEYLKVKHLRDLLHCTIGDQQLVFNEAGYQEVSESIKGSKQKCIANNFCFREKSKALCSEEFCSNGSAVTCRGCERVNVESASHKCLQRKIVVIKIIRLCHIKNLKPLLDDSSLDMKVIHLIRDPRGVMNSREKLGKDSMISIEKTCNKLATNLDFAFQRNSWLTGKYKIIRYEDLCEHPLNLGMKIYEYVGLNTTLQMKEWISQNTNASLENLGDSRGLMLYKKFQNRAHMQKSNVRKRFSRTVQPQGALKRISIREAILRDPYTTTRNSSVTWREWTSNMDFHVVESVQRVCKRTMIACGYRAMENTGQLNNPNFHIIHTLCPEVDLFFCSIT